MIHIFYQQAVYEWYLDVNDDNRKAMALMGYPHLGEAAKVSTLF